MADSKNPLDPPEGEAPVPLPIDGVLDLHTFKPSEVRELVEEYISVCRERNICDLRIIHGKGTGQLKRAVQSLLAKHPDVISFSEDHPQFGGWGATLVRLKV